MAGNVSLCMIVRDEAECLARCLESVQGAVDEVVVVDTGSRDDTVAIARRYGALVREVPWQNDFAAARNESLKLATCEWILCLDADEELAAESRSLLKELVNGSGCEGYFLQIHNLLGSAADPEWEVGEAFRLFRNRPVYRFVGAIHEQILPVILAVNPEARVEHSALKVVHYGYLQEWVAAKGKADRNLKLLQASLSRRPEDPYLLFNLGLELLLHRRFREAQEALEAALARTPFDADWRPRLIKCYAAVHCERGRWKEALAFLAAEAARYPDFTDLRYMMGVAHGALGQHEEAARAYTACLGLGPAPSEQYGAVDPEMGSCKALLGLGQAYEAQGRYAEAMQAYARAAMVKRGWLEPLRYLTSLMARRVDEGQMLRVLEAFFPGAGAESRVKMAGLLVHAGRFALALERLQGLAAAGELDGEGRYLYAYCLAKSGRWDEALAICRDLQGGGAPEVQALAVYCQVCLGQCRDLVPATTPKERLRELYAALAPLLTDEPPDRVARFRRCLPRGRWLEEMAKRRR
jgi:tetratricopeptide (TPR) repeat protein